MDIKTIISSCIVSLLKQKNFYGHIVQQMERVFVQSKNSIQTFAVGKHPEESVIKLFINEDFVKKVFEKSKSKENFFKSIEGVIEHEILHVCLGHLNIKFQDWSIGCIAMDLTVNSYIDKNRLPDGVFFPEMFGFPDKQSCLWYYEELKKKKDELYDKFKKAMENSENSHSLWKEMFKDPLIGELIKDIIRKSDEICKACDNYGNVPSEILREIGTLLGIKKAQIPWYRVLRSFCANATENNLNYTLKRVSKRYHTRPGTIKEEVLNLAVGVDTSGSEDNESIKNFFNEIYHIWRNGAKVTIFECDCSVHKTYEYNGKFDFKIVGGGGTDLEPVLVKVEGKFDALVYFTDGYASPISRKYRIPTLWVINSDISQSDFPCDWGKMTRIKT